ncbi:MAG: metal ABC transporter permease, partial [Planctomycetota bacterium]
GWPVSLLDFGVLILLTATTVIGLPAVGVVLMVAMLVLPGASARFWTDRLSVLLVVAAAIGFLVAGAGTFASASFERLPAGPIIVLCGTAVFAFSVLFAPRRGLLARRRREREQHDRRLRHRILRFLFERVENEDAPDPDLATIVSELGAPRRSVGRTLRTLRRNGMVESIAPRVVLNEHGWNRATRVVRTLRLWEQYLLTHANIDRDLVDPDAEIIERILPSDVIHELEVALHEAGRVPELPERATEGSAT